MLVKVVMRVLLLMRAHDGLCEYFVDFLVGKVSGITLSLQIDYKLNSIVPKTE